MLTNKAEHCHQQANPNEQCINRYDYILKPT